MDPRGLRGGWTCVVRRCDRVGGNHARRRHAPRLAWTIDAEKFDNGGEGVAYHDTTRATPAAQYPRHRRRHRGEQRGRLRRRLDRGGRVVELHASTSPAQATTRCSCAWRRRAARRCTSASTDRSAVWKAVIDSRHGRLADLDDGDVPVTLGAGTQQMTLVFDTGGMNIDARSTMASSSGTPAASGLGAVSPARRWRCRARSRPQNFDNGGEGVAYHDTTPATPAARTARPTSTSKPLGRRIRRRLDRGRRVAELHGERRERRQLHRATARRVAGRRRRMHVGLQHGQHVWSSVTIPATGGWQTWTTVNVPVTLGAGTSR